LESVVDGVTGVLFEPQSVDGIIAAVRRFESTEFSVAAITENAARFSRSRFEAEIARFVECYAVPRRQKTREEEMETALSWN
jgi:hypothetical protein